VDKRKLIFGVCAGLIVLFFTSCRHELDKPKWDVGVLAPLVKSSLTIKDILVDSLIQEEADSSLKIVFQNELYRYALDDALKLPDTPLKKTVSLD